MSVCTNDFVSFSLSFSRNRVLLGMKVYVNYVKFMLNLNLFFVKICYVKMTTWTRTEILLYRFIIVFNVPVPKKTVVAAE